MICKMKKIILILLMIFIFLINSSYATESFVETNIDVNKIQIDGTVTEKIENNKERFETGLLLNPIVMLFLIILAGRSVLEYKRKNRKTKAQSSLATLIILIIFFIIMFDEENYIILTTNVDRDSGKIINVSKTTDTVNVGDFIFDAEIYKIDDKGILVAYTNKCYVPIGEINKDDIKENNTDHDEYEIKEETVKQILEWNKNYIYKKPQHPSVQEIDEFDTYITVKKVGKLF